MTSKPVTYGQHPRRGTCPTGLAPRKASQVGFRQLAGSCSILSPPALAVLSAYVPGLRLAATRTRATKDADSDAGLAIAPLQSWDDSDDGPITGPLQSPGGTSLLAAQTRWRHLRPRLDPATPPSSVSPRAPVPGRVEHFNSPHLVTIPQRPGDPARPGLQPQPRTLTRQLKLDQLFYHQSSCDCNIFSAE